MFNYPNPCEKCTKPMEDACDYRKCRDYAMFMNTMWKRYRTYPIRKFREEKQEQNAQCFRYEHPDLIRRYLKDGPCKGCQFELLCDVPCGAYYHWWDARMTVLREKYGGCMNNETRVE